MRYFVQIDNSDSRYRGSIYRENGSLVLDLPELQLGPDVWISINKRDYKLADILKYLISVEAMEQDTIFDERGQLELGQFLYGQLFGGLDSTTLRSLRDEHVEVRIVTDDEHVGRLPWVLLASNGVFLSRIETSGWSVALSTGRPVSDCELPPSPQLLFVMPEPKAQPPTGATHHLESLEKLLSGANRRHAQGYNLKVVKTWDEFAEASRSFKPDVVYFYGHGSGDLQKSSLVFETADQRGTVLKPVADFANCLRQANGEAPLVAYVNCCLGDAGGLLGVGWQLGDFIPAVITNCTYARISAAQAQAKLLLRSLLIKAEAPHIAVSRMRSNLADINFSLRDVRWMTPVLHSHYGTWKAHPPQQPSRLQRDPYWFSKVDRKNQYSEVSYDTRNMLLRRRPRCLAYIWYGKQRQGVDFFHNRLEMELPDELHDVHLYTVFPTWPREFENFNNSMTNMITDAFGVQSLEEIPARIRTESRGFRDRMTLVYVRHQPIVDTNLITIDRVKRYIEWWNEKAAARFADQIFGLIGISFEVSEPELFEKELEKREWKLMALGHTHVQVLKQMGPLTVEDLIDEIRKHDIRLPRDFDISRLYDLIKKVDGEYELLLDELRKLEDDGWN